jgi:diguanylate cyclase (GGDEF)-like protein/PAS domain S-box-containing protein
LPISWNIPLVLLSLLIATIGSFTALTHAQRMRESTGRAAMLWMVAGGCTLGVAVWSMHFIGMLALHLPIPIAYDLPLTIYSLLPAIAAALLGFRVLRATRISARRILLSGLLMGVGISLMHYTGVAALKMSPPISHDPWIVALSIAIGVIASWGALLMMYQGERINLPQLPRFVVVATILGLAISGMHYTALLGMRIEPGSMCLADALRIEPNVLAVLVSLVSVMWFSGGILATLFDRRIVRQNAEELARLEQSHWNLRAKTLEKEIALLKSLRESEERSRLILDRAMDAVVNTDEEGQIIEWNAEAERIFGYMKNEAIGRDMAELILPELHRENHRVGVMRYLQALETDVLDKRIEITALRKGGEEFPVELSVIPFQRDKQIFFSAFLRDITERQRIQMETSALLRRNQTLMKTAVDGIHILDIQGNVVEANDSFCRLLGYTPEEVVTLNVADWDVHWSSEELRERMRMLVHNSASATFETVHRRKDGTLVEIEISCTGVEIDGRHYLFASSRDITGRKLAEQQIHQLAFYDVLTKLPNRRLLMDRLQQALSVSARNGQRGAVLFLDLDNFKTLNDTKGHDIGDLLLIEVAKRLVSCVRDGDTVARLGGDEFVVALETLSVNAGDAARQAEMIAEKIRTALNLPYQLEEYTLRITPSIGIVLFHGHQETLDDLLKHADTAMYQAKTAGRNAIRFYDSVMQAAIEARAEMADELHLALEKQQFCLHCQIQVDSLRRVLGVEVLLRWDHPQNGLVSTAQFIPLAEEIGLIVPIGLWVLKTACAQLKAWQKVASMRDLTLAVNVSAKQFRQPDFVDQVRRVLLESGAKPSLLKLELTESTVLENIDDTISRMRELKQLGVSFSMDDFGTGYSSLQYLKRLPLDQIKIDQSFVRDIITDPNDAAIVQAIIAMSDALGLNVIAEGVESEVQRAFLDKHGCHAFQGFLFSEPVPLDQIEAVLRGRDPKSSRHSSALP